MIFLIVNTVSLRLQNECQFSLSAHIMDCTYLPLDVVVQKDAFTNCSSSSMYHSIILYFCDFSLLLILHSEILTYASMYPVKLTQRTGDRDANRKSVRYKYNLHMRPCILSNLRKRQEIEMQTGNLCDINTTNLTLLMLCFITKLYE